MDLAIVGLLISGTALLISVWTRIESFQSLRRQRRVDLVRRLGDSLVHALEARSLLSDALTPRISALEAAGHEFNSEAEENYHWKLIGKYSDSWKLVEYSETLLLAASAGKGSEIDPVRIESAIALLNQLKHEARRALESKR